jgi:hypothetical protein
MAESHGFSSGTLQGQNIKSFSKLDIHTWSFLDARAHERLGWEVVSLDILKKFNPTHQCDIMDFVYTQYPRGYFDIIWASPECKVYSPDDAEADQIGLVQEPKDGSPSALR